MPHRDFDVASLAKYLHLDAQKVQRLADRGKLPARKVGGQWRFARAEIHQWLENRIGLSDDEELVEMEEALVNSAPPEDRAEILIAEILPCDAVAIPLGARTRNSVVTTMVELAANTGWLWDPEKMADAVRAREELHSTALENGVALMHPRRPMPAILDRAFLALGVSGAPIPFGTGVPMTDIFFLICSVEDRGHLRTLARLSRILAAPGFLEGLRAAPDAVAAWELIRQTEQRLS